MKKNSFIKLIGVLCVGILALVGLTACGGSSSGAPAQTASSGGAEAAEAASGTKITVTCKALGAPEPVVATIEIEIP